jgi:8-hydroxy-5-deazaflavin:NADPH oxidoreductase
VDATGLQVGVACIPLLLGRDLQACGDLGAASADLDGDGPAVVEGLGETGQRPQPAPLLYDPPAMTRVAIIGAGNVGRALGAAWITSGHQVTFGSRTPSAADVPSGAAVREPVPAVRDADVVVYALPGAAMAEVLEAHGPVLVDRIVIDTTNNMAAGQAGADLSAIRYLPQGVAGFRTFNSVGWENMADPLVAGERADMCYAGPDGPGRPIVGQLIADVGFRPVYVGATPQALAAVDGLAALWFALALGRGLGRRLAFRVLTEQENLS